MPPNADAIGLHRHNWLEIGILPRSGRIDLAVARKNEWDRIGLPHGPELYRRRPSFEAVGLEPSLIDLVVFQGSSTWRRSAAPPFLETKNTRWRYIVERLSSWNRMTGWGFMLPGEQSRSRLCDGAARSRFPWGFATQFAFVRNRPPVYAR
jgi:hypothetical protein